MQDGSDVTVPELFIDKRVAMLTNVLLRHNVVVLEALDPWVREMRTFLSTQKETERKQSADWGSLDVVVQKSFKWARSFTNVHGYRDISHIQVPYDTLAQLWRYQPDVVVTGQFGGRTIFATIYKLLRPKTRLVIWATLSQRTEATRGKLLVSLRKAVLKHADACFTHGPDAEAYLRQLGFAGPVFYAPYVIESNLYEGESLVPNDGITRLLYTGQFIPRKGLYPFTQALCEWCLKHPDRQIIFRLGGEGPEQERLENLTLPKNVRIEFLGHLDGEGMTLALRSNSIYVFPTLGDEWGMVVNEALSAGLPVLASEHAQASERLIREGSNGWLFDPTCPESLASSLDRALSTDHETLGQMAQNARRSVESWTPTAIAKAMASALLIISESVSVQGTADELNVSR